ncbi:MAG: hypothetical protein GEU86_21730 [Actinophytocola sp.]|nr:hypothetical protein [Actinophytocola sp.]
MSLVGIAELVAWSLSAVIAGWLLVDVIRVPRHHGEEALVNPGESMDPITVERSDQAAVEGSHP